MSDSRSPQSSESGTAPDVAAVVPGSAFSLDLTGPLRREIEELKRELERYKGWVDHLGKEANALRAGINARLNGHFCPESTWGVNVELAAKLECLVSNDEDQRGVSQSNEKP